jgi:ABC-type glutathione transport system ATPase component
LRQHTDYNDSEVRELAMEHLEKVGLTHAANRYPSELSGGMKKRAGLARGLVLDPGIVLADEPDSGLDPVRTALLGELLIERHAELGGTLLVITHNMMLANRVSDYVAVLWKGKIVAAGPAELMFSSDDPLSVSSSPARLKVPWGWTDRALVSAIATELAGSETASILDENSDTTAHPISPSGSVKKQRTLSHTSLAERGSRSPRFVRSRR